MRFDYLHTHWIEGEPCDVILHLDADRDGTSMQLMDRACPQCAHVFTANEVEGIEAKASVAVQDAIEAKADYESRMKGSAYGIEEWL